MHKNLQKIKFRKNDKLRALLTETLPYEVPLLFSNEGLYRGLKGGLEDILKTEFEALFYTSKPTVPYDYKIKKNSHEYRSLAVMHPSYQRAVAEFYAKYDSLIIGLCQRSLYTLRSPVKVASHYVEKNRAKRTEALQDKYVESEKSGFDSLAVTASSYFVYRRYGLIYKFYESSEFTSLEKQYKNLLRLDISHCFSSVYTHSISWAIKGKKFAKKFRAEASFSNDFDALMQFANWGETNGILIGPEVSRIFAELILQRVDAEVQVELEERNLFEGKDYSIRRYVDDYFMFAHDRKLLDVIATVLARQLHEYKLHLNPSKTAYFERPFLTGESVAKVAVSEIVSNFFSRYTEIVREPIEVVDATAGSKSTETTKTLKISFISDPLRSANSVIQDIKKVVANNRVTYESISSYFFGILKRRIGTVLRRSKLDEHDEKFAERLERLLSTIIEIVFFVYAMNPRVRPTYQISEMIVAIKDVLEDAPPHVRENIIGKIAKEATEIVTNNCDESEDNIELLNLLIALKNFGDDYLYDEAFLCEMFKIGQPNDIKLRRPHLGYFQIVTLLYYIEDKPQFANLFQAINSYVTQLFAEDGWQYNSELSTLFLDYIRCPFVSRDIKKTLIKNCIRHRSSNDLAQRTDEVLNAILKQYWFFSWNGGRNLSKVLQRKELRTPY